MEITKNKNLVTFNCEDGKKPYVLDINTATMFGRNGRALVHVPSEICHYLTEQYNTGSYKDNWIIAVFAYEKRWNNVDSLLGNSALLRLADKLDSLKYRYRTIIESSSSPWDYLVKNEKDFIKTVVKNPDITIDDFIKEHEIKELMKEFNIKEETFSSSELSFIRDFASSVPIFKKYFDYFCYYTKQGMPEIIEYDSIITYTMQRYFQMCEDLSIVPEKTVFTKTFSMISRLHKERQNQIIKERLLTYSKEMREKLFFENDTFTIVIPSCPMDFHKEAQAQDNCVERIYQARVVTRETNVVFVRKKEDTEKSYITCEVDSEGHIKQFLLSHNRFPREKIDLEFMHEYQNFLKTSMGQ